MNQLVEAAAESYLALVDRLYLEIDALEDTVDDLPSAMLRQRLSSLRHEMIHARRMRARPGPRSAASSTAGSISNDDALFPTERAFADTYDTLVRVVEERRA